MVEYVSLVGLIYTFGKDVWSYIKENDAKNEKEYKENECLKVNTSTYLMESGLSDKWTKEGYLLRWTIAKNIATRELDGWEIMYVIDDKKKIIYSLCGQDSILMGRKENSSKTNEQI